MTRTPRGSRAWIGAVVVAVAIVSAAGVPNALAEPPDPSEVPDSAISVPQAGTAVEADNVADEKIVSAAIQPTGADPASSSEELMETSLEETRIEETVAEYDPWQPFNEPMFSFNRQLDRVAIKPAATVWDKILPDPAKRSLGNAFDNLGMPRRFVNKLFQLRLKAASLELTRFILNSTMGFAGFFDVAKAVGIEKKDADTGQTLGVYGAGPGPYLVLPFLPPLTVRDGIGAAVDAALDPLSYVLPIAALVGMKGGNIINARSINLELYQNVEEGVIDLYSAVRNGYLQRRNKAIQDAVQDQPFR